MSQADRDVQPDAPHRRIAPDAAPGSAPTVRRTTARQDRGRADRRRRRARPAQRLLGRMVCQVRARGVGDLFRPKVALRGWPTRSATSRRTCRSATWRRCAATTTASTARRSPSGWSATPPGPPPASARPAAGSPRSSGRPRPPCCPRRCCWPPRRSPWSPIEIKLIGELHEVYGVPVPGHRRASARSHLMQAWAQQRGVNPLLPGRGRRRRARHRRPQGAAGPAAASRFGRNLTTLGPLLTGAAVAGYLNRRATRSLGDRIREDLRKQHRDRSSTATRRADRSSQQRRRELAPGGGVLTTQYGVGSAGSSRTTCTAPGPRAAAPRTPAGRRRRRAARAGRPRPAAITSATNRTGRRASSTRSSSSATATRMRPSHHRPTTASGQQHHERQPGADAGGAQPDLGGEQRRPAPSAGSHSHHGTVSRSA